MAKGGGTQTSYVQQSTSNLPAYAQPYYTGLMERASTATTTPYQTYDQERIAGFTPEQQQVQQNVLGAQTPQQFGAASDTAKVASEALTDAGKYTAGQFNAERVGLPALQNYQMQGPQRFGGWQAGQYMSPFVQQALEPQMREAIYSAQRGQLGQDLGAARQGTYGGSRQLLASMERERNLGQQLGDIQSKGLQAAYEQAAQQFNTEQALRQQAGQQNLQAALGVQQLGTESGLQAALANQQYGFEAQKLGEQSRQFGAGQGLAAAQAQGQLAQTLGNLGQMQGQLDLSRLGMQQQTAAQQQALNQQYLDTAYQDFLRQQNYPMEQLQQYSSLLHGVPITPNTTTSTSAPAPSLASQIMGTGVGALGLAKALG